MQAILRRSLIPFLCFSLSFSIVVGAEDKEVPGYQAELKVVDDGKISNLTWQTTRSIRLIRKGSKSDPTKDLFALVRGEFKEEANTSIGYITATGKGQDQQLPFEKNKDQTFDVQIPITDTESPFEVVVVDARGGINTQKCKIIFSDWSEYTKAPEQPVTRPKIFWIGASAAPNYTNYNDTRTGVFTEFSLSGILYAGVQLPKGFELGLSGSFDAFTFAMSTPISARLAAVSGRVGFRLPWLKDPWNLTVNLGYFYRTMLVSPALLGFYAANGVEIFPTASFTLPNKSAIHALLKFSPFSATGWFSFESYNLHVGLRYFLAPFKFGKLGLGTDFTLLRFYLSSSTTFVTTVSVGPIYEF